MMLAAAKALKCGKEWYDDVNATYSKRRLIAEQIMETLGCRFDRSQSGLFLWGRIPESEIGSEALADKILYGAKVFITPGFIFGSNGERYVRISLCATQQRMAEALERIKAYLNK